MNKEKLEVLRNVLSGCGSYSDAVHYTSLFINSYPELENIAKSYRDGFTYPKSGLHFQGMSELLNDLSKIDDDMLMKLNIEDCNQVQSNTIKRIVSSINNKKLLYNKNDNKIATKECPRCKALWTHKLSSSYVICGLTDRGFDWNYCGFDWCFKCNKKLCKQWGYDDLCCENNRHHNGTCCLEYCKKHNEDYNDYCHCINEHVRRF